MIQTDVLKFIEHIIFHNSVILECIDLLNFNFIMRSFLKNYCIYLDFATAFDRVPHQRLLTKVNNLGLQGELLNWIKDFLTRRKQRVMVNNTSLEWSDVISGVSFQSNLKFDKHVSNITFSANSRLGIIKFTFQKIERDVFLVLYKSMVRSIIEYETPIWYPDLKKHEKKIGTIQRRATKMIANLGHLSYSERLKFLNYQPCSIGGEGVI